MNDLINFIQSIDANQWSPQTLNLTAGLLTQEKTPGVLKFTPHKKTDEQLVVSVGIHGNETAPIEITWDILQQIKREEINPKLEVLFIFGHTKAMLEHKRFLDFNLNRLFSGNFANHQGACEAPRAQALEEVVRQFFSGPKRWHLDLHTAIRGSHHERFAVRPYYSEDSMVTENELNLCASMGVEAILKSTSPATTFAGFSAGKLSAQSFTVELGQVKRFGENDLSRFQMAKETIKKILSTGSCNISSDRPLPLIYNVTKELINDSEEYEFYLAEDYLNFNPLEEGQLIERNSSGELKAKAGQSVVFPNPKVPIGQRTGLLVEITQ